MATGFPLRLVTIDNGVMKAINPLDPQYYPHVAQTGYDIISYTWGPKAPTYRCWIDGTDWDLDLDQLKIRDVERLLSRGQDGDVLPFIWVDCLCINQTHGSPEKSMEISKMYQYYKSARKCHILIDMDDPWHPSEILRDLKLIGHVMTHMAGTAITSESKLTQPVVESLSRWANEYPWRFPIHKTTCTSAGIDLGVLNCYSTCTQYVKGLFNKLYFRRVWPFEEMLLGKNITMWGVGSEKISCIGELDIWMDLATESNDKAVKLIEWISDSRVLTSFVIDVILGRIRDDVLYLDALQTQVKGISSARTDIINGGPFWWLENYEGVSNVFSAISLTPRSTKHREDIFKGLLGVFNGLFTPEEIKTQLSGDDMERISFAFFRQLSIKTGRAWTRLAISHGRRGNWDWIPMMTTYDRDITMMSTDCYAGVVNLGRLAKNGSGRADALAYTKILGVPRKYMSIRLQYQPNREFSFVFRGCNCGKSQSTGLFRSEPIPTNNRMIDVLPDETGKYLVHCAMIMGSVLDPACNLQAYREKLLDKLQPEWAWTDPNAKPANWYHRCVSGTHWERAAILRSHNMSMSYRMPHITKCGSRLENESTKDVLCEVRVNCGCTLTAPFSWVFEALMAVSGSSLGSTTATQARDDRIKLQDGLGLVQAGDTNRTFSVVAFGGQISANKSFARLCRRTPMEKAIYPAQPWPRSRVLVPDEFQHGFFDMFRAYSYVPTGGSGNLLICRSHPLASYRVLGVCIDDWIPNKKGQNPVTIK